MRLVRTLWLSLYGTLNKPVLMAINTADTAVALEKKTDKEVVSEALQVRTTCIHAH